MTPAAVFAATLVAAGTASAATAQAPPRCGPTSQARACAGPVAVGARYRVTIETHCGVRGAYFGGRLWRAAPPLSDGSDNPPRGWGNPLQVGVMRRVSARHAEFRAPGGLVARFVPAPAGWQLANCN
jgi:hypothetical protein